MDIVASVRRFPAAGETVFGVQLAHHPGGKGANQATAAAKLGAETTMLGAVGSDGFADALISTLEGSGVGVADILRKADQTTGTALISVDASGENSIIVVSDAGKAEL